MHYVVFADAEGDPAYEEEDPDQTEGCDEEGVKSNE